MRCNQLLGAGLHERLFQAFNPVQDHLLDLQNLREKLPYVLSFILLLQLVHGSPEKSKRPTSLADLRYDSFRCAYPA
jgi:hypothetical protein